MKNLYVFSVFHCVEGAFDESSRGTPKLKNEVPQDELKNGRGCVWAVPEKNSKNRDKSPLGSRRWEQTEVPLKKSAMDLVMPS